MPPAIISHPAFKTLMTAQIQTFLHANPLTTTLSRAARWDQLKVHIQDVARGYFIIIYFYLFELQGNCPPSDEGTERTWFEPEQRPKTEGTTACRAVAQ